MWGNFGNFNIFKRILGDFFLPTISSANSQQRWGSFIHRIGQEPSNYGYVCHKPWNSPSSEPAELLKLLTPQCIPSCFLRRSYAKCGDIIWLDGNRKSQETQRDINKTSTWSRTAETNRVDYTYIYIYDFNLMSSLKSMEKLEHHFHSFPSFPTWEFSTLSPVAESGLRIPLGVPCWISRRAHRSPKIGTELIWLVVDLPLWKIWKSVGMMTFPTEWTHKIHVPNHQPVLEKKQLRVEFSTR